MSKWICFTSFMQFFYNKVFWTFDRAFLLLCKAENMTSLLGISLGNKYSIFTIEMFLIGIKMLV